MEKSNAILCSLSFSFLKSLLTSLVNNSSFLYSSIWLRYLPFFEVSYDNPNNSIADMCLAGTIQYKQKNITPRKQAGQKYSRMDISSNQQTNKQSNFSAFFRLMNRCQPANTLKKTSRDSLLHTFE